MICFVKNNFLSFMVLDPAFIKKTVVKICLAIMGVLIPVAFVFFPAVIYSPLLLVLSSCAAAPRLPKPQIPVYENLYMFTGYSIPEKKAPSSVPLTIAVVKPGYKKEAVVTGERGLTTDMLKVFKSFSNSIGEDISEQLIAKGMLTKGPFDDLEVITYPDKKASNLTVSVLVIFDINYEKKDKPKSPDPYDKSGGYVTEYSDGSVGMEYTGAMSLGTEVYLHVHEPMTGVKMWVKKLDFGVESLPYEYSVKQKYVVIPSGDPCAPPRTYYENTDEYLYDGRPVIFSNKLKKIYPDLLKSAWTYLNEEELIGLDKKTPEVRERKRY